jgi:mono/diheme cytochrome c family protein
MKTQIRRSKVASLALFVLVSTIAVASACSTEQPQQNANTPANQPLAQAEPIAQQPDVATEQASGKELYALNCMICHKDTGKGGPVTIDGKKLRPDDLTVKKFRDMTDEKILAYIRDGVVDEGMPAFKDKLSDDEMVAVVKYVRELQTK